MIIKSPMWIICWWYQSQNKSEVIQNFLAFVFVRAHGSAVLNAFFYTSSSWESFKHLFSTFDLTWQNFTMTSVKHPVTQTICSTHTFFKKGGTQLCDILHCALDFSLSLANQVVWVYKSHSLTMNVWNHIFLSPESTHLHVDLFFLPGGICTPKY